MKKCYSISLTGKWGGEFGYINLSKKAYDYWDQDEENDYEKLLEYISSPENYEEEVPDEANFMFDEEKLPYELYEHPDIKVYEYGPSVYDCFLSIKEVKEQDIFSDVIECLVDEKEIIEYVKDQCEDQSLFISVDKEEVDCEYLLCYSNYEKGLFMEVFVETESELDLSKLKFERTLCPNGVEVVNKIYYDGEELISENLETTGRGREVDLMIM